MYVNVFECNDGCQVGEIECGETVAEKSAIQCTVSQRMALARTEPHLPQSAIDCNSPAKK